MTVTEQSSRKVILGAGWANPLTHAYVIESAAHVHVFADAVELVQGVDYTVTDVLNPAGYAVTITNPGSWAPTNWVLDARPPIDQGKDLTVGGTFGAKYEDGLDKLARRVERVWDLARRGLKTGLSVAVGDNPYTLPGPSADSFISWNAAGTDLENKTPLAIGVALVDNDVTLAADSATRVPSQHSVKFYVTTAISAVTGVITGLGLPAPAASSFLQRNAGNTAYNAKTSTEVRNALAAAVFVADRTAVKALDPTKDKAATTYGEARRNGTWLPYLTSTLPAAEQAKATADTSEAVYLTSGLYTWRRFYDTFARPVWWGAAGDGATDDVVPLKACFEFGEPVFLKEKYAIASNLAITLNSTNKGLCVVGAGRYAQIVLNAANVGIAITITDVANAFGTLTEAVTLRDFNIVPNSTSTGAALKISAPAASGSMEKTFFIENVDIVPSTTSNYTTIGFEFFNCRNAVMNACVLDGLYGAFTGSAVKWWGATASAPVTFAINGCTLGWWGKGVELAPNSGGTTTGGNDWQGINISDSTLLACDYGVYATSVDNFAEWLSIRGCHLNCRTAGVWAPDVGYLHVIGNHFLFIANAPGGTAYAVYTQLNNIGGYKGQFGQINNNSINFSTTTTTNRVGIFAKTGGTNMWTTIRDNVMVNQTLDYDTSPSNFVFPVNSVVPKATTSGTTFDFTVPPGVKRFTLELSGVQLSGTDNLLLQLGVAGTPETTGYVGIQSYIATAANPLVQAVTSGFGVFLSLATRLASGILTFENISGNTWLVSGNAVEQSGAVLLTTSGSKTLAGVCNMVRLKTTGANTFAAGSVNVQF